jgi:hypothetical protein
MMILGKICLVFVCRKKTEERDGDAGDGELR